MTINFAEHIQSQIFLLYTGIFFVFAGILNFQITNRSRLSLLFIFLGSLGISLFVNFSDPFLHMWDEQIHAVVAKNMLKNPFKPMLMVDPVLPYDFKNWTGNHIWLHKQPLFLWQIALSFKLFGISILSLRLPSILMMAFLVFPIYRMGKIMNSAKTGIYAAILFTGSNFIYHLVSGRLNTDHNDIAFLFYITLSIWAWFEKENSEKRYWIFLIGIFAGAAILNKWLVGLLIYSLWGLNILLLKENRQKLSSYLEIITALIVTTLIALPWQLFILFRYPLESKYEYAFNSLHFFQALEGHDGGIMYHFNKIATLFGTDFIYVILVSFFIFLFSKTAVKFKIAIFGGISIVYIFYSIAATKMPAFPIIVAPLVYLMVGQSISQILIWLTNKIKKRRNIKFVTNSIGIAVVFYFFFHFLNHDKLTLKNNDWEMKIYSKNITSTEIYKKLPNYFDDENTIFFNTRNFDKLKILFHTNFNARNGIPSRTNIKKLKEHKIKVAIFDNNKLPDYILQDTTIAKIKSQIWQKNFSENIEVYY